VRRDRRVTAGSFLGPPKPPRQFGTSLSQLECHHHHHEPHKHLQKRMMTLACTCLSNLLACEVVCVWDREQHGEQGPDR
jgi:hypothetical protein